MPVGSVITLKNGTKKIMICGRLQERDSDHQVFDYCACYYPEGILNPEELFLFNNSDIDQVYFVGFQDGDEFAFREFLHTEKQKLA